MAQTMEERRARQNQYAKVYNLEHRKEIALRNHLRYPKYATQLMVKHKEFKLSHPETVALWKSNERAHRHAEIQAIIGNRCFICGKIPRHLIYHALDGKRHSAHKAYIRDHIDNFVVLCAGEHRAFHSYIEHKEAFEVLYKRIKELFK